MAALACIRMNCEAALRFAVMRAALVYADPIHRHWAAPVCMVALFARDATRVPPIGSRPDPTPSRLQGIRCTVFSIILRERDAWA